MTRLESAIFAAGLNDHGQLSIATPGSTTPSSEIILSPTPVYTVGGNLVCIACGYDHSVFIYDDGSVYAVGDDREFIIGTQDKTEYRTPVKVNLPAPIVWAACGWYYTCYLAADGTLYYCSKDLKGQQYHIKEDQKLIYVTGNTMEPSAIDEKGDVYQYQQNPKTSSTKYHLPAPVYDLVSCKKFSIALTIDHIVYGNRKLNNGKNEFAPIIDLKEVSCRQIFGYFQFAGVLSEDGSVYFYGDNNYGQLAIGQSKTRNTQFIKVASLPEPVQIMAVGQSHSTFITESGDFYTCGFNNQGQLMIDSKEEQVTPVKTSIENATNVVCGDNFTFVTVGMPTFIHPGMKHFHMLRKCQDDSPSVEGLLQFLHFQKS